MENPQEYYKRSGTMSAAGANAAELRKLPADLATLCEVVQGILIHADIAPFLYELKLTQEEQRTRHLRPLAEVLARVREIDARPLTVARGTRARVPGVCRHFALTLCGLLHEHGIPARSRCGFGAYFNPGRFEDHWVCEYWNAAKRRWILVDAQLDALQRKAFRIDFDPLDIPHDHFIIAGDAWQMCRTGRADSNCFGLSHVNLKGLWFVAGNVLRDLAALNRMEMLPWDVWGLMTMSDDDLTEERKALLDQVAALTLAGDGAFADLRRMYESDARLRVPPVVFNALRQAPEPVAS